MLSPRLEARQQRAISALLVLVISFGLFVLGAQPFAVDLVVAPWDKLAHCAVFFLLAAAIGLASGYHGLRVFIVTLAGALLLGLLDEWHQVYLPGRHAGWDDLAADAAGALAAALLLCLRRRDTHHQSGKAP